MLMFMYVPELCYCCAASLSIRYIVCAMKSKKAVDFLYSGYAGKMGGNYIAIPVPVWSKWHYCSSLANLHIHTIISSNPHVQTTLAIVPFTLLHCTGITQEACHTVFNIASHGTSCLIWKDMYFSCGVVSKRYLHMQELQQHDCPINPSPPMSINVHVYQQ